jgi:hypothetical protein
MYYPLLSVMPNNKEKGQPDLNPNARPGQLRFSLSLPVKLGRIVHHLAPQLDLNYSQIFRNGLDAVVEKALIEGKIDMKFYKEYKAARKISRDENLSGPE